MTRLNFKMNKIKRGSILHIMQSSKDWMNQVKKLVIGQVGNRAASVGLNLDTFYQFLKTFIKSKHGVRGSVRQPTISVSTVLQPSEIL